MIQIHLNYVHGFDIKIIENYNNSVIEKIEQTCQDLKLDKELFEPVDTKGKKHTIGLFDLDEKYDEFKTLGAKKYAYIKDNKIGITVSGVPKSGAKALKSLDDFNDGFVFKYEDTGKNTIVYNDNQFVFDLTDYLGSTKRVKEKYGICLLPCEYSLGISQEYADLITDNYSKKSEYKE